MLLEGKGGDSFFPLPFFSPFLKKKPTEIYKQKKKKTDSTLYTFPVPIFLSFENMLFCVLKTVLLLFVLDTTVRKISLIFDLYGCLWEKSIEKKKKKKSSSFSFLSRPVLAILNLF